MFIYAHSFSLDICVYLRALRMLFMQSQQCQFSLLDRRPTNGMVQYCAANNITLLPYGVLAGGFLSDAYLGVPAATYVQEYLSVNDMETATRPMSSQSM